MQGRHFVVKIYTPAMNAAGIKDATWHTLRHTFTSRAVMAGVDIRTVQELMGHSTITMTMRYAHLSPEHLKQAVNKGSFKIVDRSTDRTVTSNESGTTDNERAFAEAVDGMQEKGGGAERIRTAASQFCSPPIDTETDSDQKRQNDTKPKNN